MTGLKQIHALCLLAALTIVVTDGARGAAPAGAPRRWRDGAVIAEAKEGLGAVLTGEQVYFQRWGTYVDVADTSGFRTTLGVYLGDLASRWEFSVGHASTAGFLAKAMGRQGTGTAGLTVTLGFRSNQPLRWAVQRRVRGI